MTTGAARRRVRIEYYAAFREQRGTAQEEIETAAATPLEVYRELCRRHAFPWRPEGLQVAVNDEFCAWDAPLGAHDRLVFLAPVAGG